MADVATNTRYRVLSPINHNGKGYIPGDKKLGWVSLTDDEAAELLPLGAIEDAVVDEPAGGQANAGKAAKE